QKLAEYLDKTPDQLDLSGHRYLIIIDNLDLSESYVKKFLRISNNFFKRFSNCIFIFTSRTRIESQSFGSLDLTAKAMPTFSSKEETEEFFRNAVVNEDYYKTKVASEIGTVNYNKFIDELHKKMNNLPGLILPYCRTELSLIGVDLVILTGKLRKNELSGNAQDMITEVYDNAFQKLSDDTKALLFLICSHGLIHRWTLNELEYWAKARVHRWKYDMNKLEPSIKELDYYMFIHEEVYDGKAYFYILPITYTTIYFEECFSNNGMREKIIGPHFMLVESLFFNGPRKMIRDCLDAMESYDESTRFVLDSRGHDMFEENKNPLHLAASYHDDPKVIDLVWEMHPEWYRPDDIGMTPLHYAALYSNSKAVMDRLLKINRDYLDNKDFRIATYDNGFNVVHMAAQNSQHEIMQTLLDYMEAHGMNYLMEQGTNGENQAPLHTAVSCSTNPLVVEALLRHGADVTRTCRGGYTPLAMAATFNAEPEVIETLVRFGADINHKNDHRQTPLIKAILQNPNDSICEKLLSCDGIDIDALTDKGRSALLLAADLNKVDCVRMLLDHGARVDQRNIAGDTALHCAVTRGATGAAKLLLEHGANPNLKNDGGFTPLDIASGMNNYDMVKLLLGTIQHDD
ncbi:MAG: ankyrin repeat domain-containing protein, partial [Spirochaetaceae bacterium]|nr:ankyrin repeat domain-containing protein [Spirochaetaceae bacterium]